MEGCAICIEVLHLAYVSNNIEHLRTFGQYLKHYDRLYKASRAVRAFSLSSLELASIAIGCIPDDDVAPPSLDPLPEKLLFEYDEALALCFPAL